MRKVLRATLVANPILEGDANLLNEDKLKRAQSLWYHTSQCSHAMPPFDQFASISHNPHGKEDPPGPGLTSTSPAKSNRVTISNLLE